MDDRGDNAYEGRDKEYGQENRSAHGNEVEHGSEAGEVFGIVCAPAVGSSAERDAGADEREVDEGDVDEWTGVAEDK